MAKKEKKQQKDSQDKTVEASTEQLAQSATPEKLDKKPKKQKKLASDTNESTDKVAQSAEIQMTGRKVTCFVSKRDIDEALATELPYTNGQKVWVTKTLIRSTIQ